MRSIILIKILLLLLLLIGLSTVKKCDNIFLLEDGKLKEKGTFEELLMLDKNFRASAIILMLYKITIKINYGYKKYQTFYLYTNLQ